MIVNFRRLFCTQCQKVRLHECMNGLARCVAEGCNLVRNDEPLEIEPVEPITLSISEPGFIERFVGSI